MTIETSKEFEKQLLLMEEALNKQIDERMSTMDIKELSTFIKTAIKELSAIHSLSSTLLKLRKNMRNRTSLAEVTRLLSTQLEDCETMKCPEAAICMDFIDRKWLEQRKDERRKGDRRQPNKGREGRTNG